MSAETIKRLFVLALLGVALSGCATYHQPRYGADGVYFDQRPAVPRQVVVVDPGLYPFWSLDFFYFNRFHGPYRSPFFAHHPWFFHDPWLHPRRGWAGSVVWSHPVVYQAPPLDQRLWLMQEARSPVRPGRQSAWIDPGSEVQLRHRLAEDRAAATHRRSSGWTGSTPGRSASDRTHQPSVGQPARLPQHRDRAPARQQAPAPLPQPQQRTREGRLREPAAQPAPHQVRTPAPARTNPDRQRQIER